MIPTPPYMCYGVGIFPLILRNEIRGVNVLPLEPLIIGVRVSFPFDKILYLTPLSESARIDNMLHFIFFFSIDKVRWRPRVMRSVRRRLLIRCEKIHMKHWVYLPLIQ